jgi:arabinofuranosyltransferase
LPTPSDSETRFTLPLHFHHANLWRWVLLLLFTILMVRLTWIADDAAITLRSVLNWTHGYGPNFNLDERVQSYTHPLWFLLVTLGYLLLDNVFYSMILLSWVCVLLALWLLTRLNHRFTPWTLVALLSLLLSQAFMDYTTSGLETPLAFLLMALFVVVHQLPEQLARRLPLLVLVAGLAYLTRPDMALLLVAPVLDALYRNPRQIVRALLLGGLPVLIWSGFSLLYYGFFLPNTAYAKLNNGIPQVELLMQGWRYILDSLHRDPITLAFIALIGAFAVKRGDRLDRLLAIGVLLYLLYVLKIGGDFMSGRFFALPLFTMALIAARQVGSGHTTPLLLMILVLGLAGQASSLQTDGIHKTDAIKSDGISDERAFYFEDRGLLSQDRYQFFDSPPWPSRGSTNEEIFLIRSLCGDVGYQSLEAGPLVHFIDQCGLADPLLARLTPDYRRKWRIGHFIRSQPKGYLESIVYRRNLVEDPEMARFYDDIRLITREPLFASGRIGAIARANLGLLSPPAPAPAPELTPLTLADLAKVKPSGGYWKAEGNILFYGDDSLDIELGQRQHAGLLNLSVDHNDQYRISYLRDGEYVGESRIPPRKRHEGLSVQQVKVPPLIAVKGYDALRLQGMQGDGVYVLGHLLLEN